jgi:hypothetical protein
MTRADLEAIVEGLVPVLRARIADAILAERQKALTDAQPSRDRLTLLEDNIRELQVRLLELEAARAVAVDADR